jgi:hypothetical protein
LLFGLTLVGGMFASAMAWAGFWPAVAVISALLFGLAGCARTEWRISAGQIGAALEALKGRAPYFETEDPSPAEESDDAAEAMHTAAE